MSTPEGIKKHVESSPGPRCECGKASFRSTAHARAHARGVHSERMRIYSCYAGGVHLTNHEKSLLEYKRVAKRSKTARRRSSTRIERHKVRQALANYDTEER